MPARRAESWKLEDVIRKCNTNAIKMTPPDDAAAGAQ
jgi:hypothetical protein